MLTKNDKVLGATNATRWLRFHKCEHLVYLEADGHLRGYRIQGGTPDTSIVDWLLRMSGRHNVYAHINLLKGRPERGKASKKDVAAVRYLGVDIDPPADLNWSDPVAHAVWLDAAVVRLKALDNPPSHINCSGAGIQAFWRLAEDIFLGDDQPLFADIEARNRYLGEVLGGDKGVYTPDRIWRVPGLPNLPMGRKKQGRPVLHSHVIEFDSRRRYRLDDFPLPPAPAIATLATIARPAGEMPRHIEDRIRASEPGRRSEDFHAVVCGLADQGLSETAIEAELLRHPDGPAAKYAGRLPEEIRRCLSKWTPKSTPRNSTAAPIGHNASPEEPMPLFRDVPPGAEFPVDAMGKVMAAATKAFHEETQAPLALCGNSVLAAATLAVQQGHDVLLPHGGRSPTSSYFATVALSGERKSAVDAKVLKPVRDYEEELRGDYEIERRDYLDHKDAWDASRKKTLSAKLELSEKRQELKDLGPEPKPPLRPVRAVSDITSEGLFGLLEYVLSGAVFASEGGQFTGGHGMSDEAKLRNAAFFSLLWDRGGADRIRAKEEPKVLTGRRLSIHILVQPDVAFRFFSDPILKDQGLLSRFLLAYPDSRMGQRKFVRKLGLDHVTAQVCLGARVKELLRRKPPTKDGDAYTLDPKALALSDEATELFIRFVDEIEAQLGPQGHFAQISGLANKLPEHAARLAAVATIIDDPSATEIGPDAMRGGIQLGLYYASEAHRITMMSQAQVELQEAKELWVWIDKKWMHDHISIPDLMWVGPNFVRVKDKAEELVAILVSHGYLAPSSGKQLIGDNMRRQAWKIWGRGA